MKPFELVIPPQTSKGVWCTNGSMLVRNLKTGQYSNYVSGSDEYLECAFRERIGADGNIFGCRIMPNDWKVFEVFPLLVTEERVHEDPRLWIFRGQPFISYTHNHGILTFSPYFPDQKTVPQTIVLPFGQNGQPGGMVQKNWGFFEHEGNLCCLYLPGSTFVVFELKLQGEGIGLANLSSLDWTLEQYRGGSPPVFWNGLYYTFVHKMCDYNIWALCFKKDEDGKWRVKGYTPNRLNTVKGYEEEIHFVSGALFDTTKQEWILTGGVRDHHIGIWNIPHEDLLKQMTYL